MRVSVKPTRLHPDQSQGVFAVALAGLLFIQSVAMVRGEPPGDCTLIHYSEGTREEALAKAKRLGWSVVYDNDRGRFLVCKPPPLDDKAPVTALMLGNEANASKLDRTPAERIPSLAIPPGGSAGVRMIPAAISYLLKPVQLPVGLPVQPPKNVQSDQYRHRLWGLDLVHASDPPDATKIDQQPVVVAVIDTGIDYDHEDLKAVLWVNPGEGRTPNGVDDDHNGIVDDIHGVDFTQRNDIGYPEPTGEPLDDHGHGTHVAGTIAAVRYNGLGIAGVTPRVRIMALKALRRLAKITYPISGVSSYSQLYAPSRC
jgi:subtilisin family serine protease